MTKYNTYFCGNDPIPIENKTSTPIKAVHMNAARKKLNAAKSRRNINMLSNELQGVQKIMIKNLDDVLQRGVAINELDSKASNLSMMSQNYRKNASLLNTKATFAKVVAGSILFICFALYFWVL